MTKVLKFLYPFIISLVYYRKKASDENRDTLKGIVGSFRNEPKNIPHDIDRFCRHLEMNKPLLSSLTAMSSLERILLVPRKGKKKINLTKTFIIFIISLNFN